MSNEPLMKLRDGLITATVWENTTGEGENEKTRLSIEIVRSYKDGDDWKTTANFSSVELLKVSQLASRTYDAIVAQRASIAKE